MREALSDPVDSASDSLRRPSHPLCRPGTGARPPCQVPEPAVAARRPEPVALLYPVLTATTMPPLSPTRPDTLTGAAPDSILPLLMRMGRLVPLSQLPVRVTMLKF